MAGPWRRITIDEWPAIWHPLIRRYGAKAVWDAGMKLLDLPDWFFPFFVEFGGSVLKVRDHLEKRP